MVVNRVVSTIATVGLCLLAGVVGSALTRHFGTSSYTLSYADFISVMLTAISLLMALLAFFIAILAFIGWNSVSGKVASEVGKYLTEGFKDGQPLHKMLVDQANRARYEGIQRVDADFEDDIELDEDGNPRAPQ